jgi:NADPH-dependent curcumin reductase CurA
MRATLGRSTRSAYVGTVLDCGMPTSSAVVAVSAAFTAVGRVVVDSLTCPSTDHRFC